MTRMCILVLIVSLDGQAFAQPADSSALSNVLALIESGRPERMDVKEWNAYRRLVFAGVAESPDEAAPFVPFLKEALRDSDTGVATSAAATLLAVDPGASTAEAAAIVVSGLQSADPEVRGDTRDALANLGQVTAELVPVYRAAVRADVEYKWALAEALSKAPVALIDDLLEPLTELLSDADPRTRTAAARALGGYGGRAASAQSALRRRLESDDIGERVAVVAALAAIQSPPARALLAVLVEAMQAPDHQVRWSALQTAKLWGGQAATIVTNVVARLEDDDQTVRWAAANLLGHIGPPAMAALPALRALAVRDAQWHTGTEAKLAIRSIENVPEVDWTKTQPRDVLLRALASTNARDRLSAVQHLQRREVDRPWARPLARAALKDADIAVRYQAAYVLSSIEPSSGPALLPVFREMLHSTVVINGSNPKALANIALAELGRAGLDVLIDALTDRDEDTRVNAVHGLMYADALPPDAEQALLDTLHDSSSLVRHQALIALVKRRAAPTQVVPMLVTWLSDGAASTRLEAARSLSAYGPVAIDAANALRATTRDADRGVSMAAAAALAAVEPANAVDLLPRFIERFEAALKATSPNETDLIEAASALGGFGPAARGTMPMLLDAFGSTEGAVQTVIGVSAIRIDPDAGAPVLTAFIDALAVEDTRDVALWALQTLGPLARAAEAAVATVANDPDAFLREEAAKTLLAIRRR